MVRHKLPLLHQHPQVLDAVVPVAGAERDEAVAVLKVVPRARLQTAC